MPENELRTLLAKASADRPPGIRLTPARPRTDRLWLPVTAAVAAAVTALVLIMPGTTPSANAQVMAAVETTSAESYRIATTSGDKTFTGSFDPAQRVGVIVRNDGAETRFVGDTIYGKDPGDAKWYAAPRFDDELKEAPAATGLVKLLPLDPSAALAKLRAATEVQEEGSVSDGTRYTFALAEEVSGLVDIDDQDRIRHLEITFADGHTVEMDFIDFGTDVSVEAPPQDQIETEPRDKQVNEVPKPGEPQKKPTPSIS